MDELIERGVQLCFEDEILQTIVRILLKEYHERARQRPESLQIIAIKAIMKRRMEKKFLTNVIFKLIFKVPIDIYDYRDQQLYHHLVDRIIGEIQRILTRDRHRKQIQKLKSDPCVVLELLDQNLDSASLVDMIIGKDTFRIELTSWKAEFENRPGTEYDTFWAEKFARMLLSGKVGFVWIVIEDNQSVGCMFSQRLRDILDNFVASLNPITPPEGWKQFIEDGKRPFYVKSEGTLSIPHRYGNLFLIANCCFKTEWEPLYWGWLER